MQLDRKGTGERGALKIASVFVALPALAVMTLYAACHHPETGDACPPGTPDCDDPDRGSPTCGNGQVEGDELCDVADLNRETCKTLGDGLYTGGKLLCSSMCTFDVTMCTGRGLEICSDGIDNDDDGQVDCSDADCATDPSCDQLGGMGGQPGSAGNGGAPGAGGAPEPTTAGAGGVSEGGASQGIAGAGEPGSGGAGGASGGPSDKLIFRTEMPKKANFGGIPAADGLCNASSLAEVGKTYKALIVDGTTRRACTTANCAGGVAEHLDWVLAPDTAYARPDATRIGTTNSAGVFAFPLEASIAFGSTYWTGLSADWTSSSDDCGDWSQTSGYFAYQGNGDVTTSDAIAGVTESCATLAGAYFVCVEQ